jgi:hypothetical protein
MNIEFIEKDHISQEARTNFWFTVDEIDYALSVADDYKDKVTVTLLDSDGCPVLACNDHNDVKGKLTEHPAFEYLEYYIAMGLPKLIGVPEFDDINEHGDNVTWIDEVDYTEKEYRLLVAGEAAYEKLND